MCSRPSLVMESEERVRATVQEVVRDYRLFFPQGAPSLSPFISHVAWFLVQATLLQRPQLCVAGVNATSFKEVVDRCSKLLTLKDCPAIETIQLQVSAHAHMFMQQMNLATEERDFMKKADDIVRSILSIQVLDRRESNMIADKLHKLVVEFIMETSERMDEDFSFDEFREDEINAALNSIFPRTGFLYWINQSEVEKASQLQELSNIIPGIRAYNRARGKSVSVNDLSFPNFEKEAQDMEKRVEKELNNVVNRIAAYRKAINLNINPLEIHHVLIQRLRDELHFDLQLLSFMQDLKNVLTEMHLRMSKLSERFQEQLEILCATIGLQAFIPNELVFPEFRNIGLFQRRASTELRKFRAQSRVAEELLALSSEPNFKRTPVGLAGLMTNHGFSKIQLIIDSCAFLPAHVYTTTANQVGFKHEASNLSNVGIEKVIITDGKDASTINHEVSNLSDGGVEKVVVIDGKDTSTLKCLRLQLNGFCVMSIIRHGGLLVNGDPKAGLVQVGEKSYAFSTSSYMNEFVKSPKDFLNTLDMMVIMMPQLINTLGLQREPKFAHLAIPNILELVNKQPLELEFATQTTTHIQPEHQFDEDTLFLRAAELASKQTHSSQTECSHFHRDSCSQVWLPRNNSTQSLFGKGTTMPIKLKFFENLRGPPNLKFNPVDILLDV